MSAKGRQGKQVEENEFYPTPRNAILALLESDLVELPGGVWIEPCAGSGRIVSTVNDFRDDVSWIMCELDTRFAPCLAQLKREHDVIAPFGDFVHREWPLPKASVLIMNPPFSMTMQFVQCGLTRADWVVSLQRQGWFGTRDRAPWLRDHCPDSFQIPRRLSFRPDGRVDNCEYSWFVWPPGSLSGRRTGCLGMLGDPQGGQQLLL